MNQPDSTNDDTIKTIGGIVMQVAGPALTILVVYSIAAFLVEIGYGSGMVGRVKWIFFLFSFAAVLISRISIEEGYERASVLGFLLGLAILLTSARLLQGNLLFLVGMLTFVWWSAGRLTWDCTFIDNSRDATGQGMIDLAIDRVSRFRKGETSQSDHHFSDPMEGVPPDPALVQGADPDPPKKNLSAWDKFVLVFWSRKQANTPGLWAFYFLLLGLPLFGIGQLMLGMNDDIAHRAAAVHFFWYVTGLLGLLMLSSVLGLHRYLEKNQSAMPGRLARRWITAGTILAIGITGFCFLLPRPTAQYSIGNWLPKLTTRNTTPSDQSFGDDGQEQSDDNNNVSGGPKSRENRGEKKQQDGDSQSDNTEKSEDGAKRDTKGGDSAGGKSDDGKKGSGGKKKENSKDSGKSKSKSDSKQGEQSGDKQQDKGQKKEGEQGEQKSEKDSEKQKGLQSPNERNQKKSERKKNQPSGQSSKRKNKRPNQKRQNQKRDQQNSKKKEPDQKKSSTNLTTFIGKLFKFIVWLVALLAILWFSFKYRDRIMPWIRSFIAEMREFWNRLWNREKKQEALAVAETEKKKSTIRLPGFAQFSNPFTTDAARSWSPDQLVKYTFEAFEAWSRDHQCPRAPDQTALEFARNTASRFEPLNKEVNYLAGLYSQLAYASSQSQGAVSRSAAMALSPLWEKLTTMYSPQPAS